MNDLIRDEEIPFSDPADVVRQFEPLLYKISQRYSSVLSRSGVFDQDDLVQSGRIAIIECQKKYDPCSGSFLNFLFNPVRRAMRRTLGFNDNTGEAPEELRYLDADLPDAEGITLLDMIPDPNLTAEERIIEQDTRDEIAEAVHAAVDRLKNERQREIIRRCWLRCQDRQEAADEMGIGIKSLRATDLEARYRLRRDKALKKLAYPNFHVGVAAFHSSMCSEVERIVLWREQRFDEIYGGGSFVHAGKKDR